MNTYRMGWFGWVVCLLVAAFMMLPLVVIAILAFSDANNLSFPPPAFSTRHMEALTSSKDWRDSLTTSARLGLISTAVGVALGVPLALGLSRGRIGQVKAIQALVAAPLIVPAVTMSIGFYFVSAKAQILDSLLPLVLAHVTVGMPMIVVTVLAADRGVDPTLEPAARTLGASFGTTIRRITLPLIAPGIAAGAVFAFLTSWDDIVNAVFLGTPRVRPFPLKLWNEMQFSLTPIVASASVLLSTVSIGLVTTGAVIFKVRQKRMSRDVTEAIVLSQGA